ncbi:MAG TPA: cytochrome c peroxidase [Gemmataceae bacterium]
MVVWPLTAALLICQSKDIPPPIPEDTLPAILTLDAIPLGLSTRTVPDDNPLTEARVTLGRKLFFDPILSGDRTVACASCHQPQHGFTSGAAQARGIGGKATKRKAPTLLNRAYGTALFWDGHETSLEAQALRPIEDPTEMGAKLTDVIKNLQAHKEYKDQFDTAFTDGVTAANLGKALASFERVLLRGDSAIDRFRRKGDRAALTAEERHGLWLYESKGHCWKCHSGANFTDEQFHNTGVSWGKEPLDLGRFAVTKRDADRGRFKTPTLRGVSKTAPYMHNGSVKTLEEVVDFYNRGGGENPNRDEALKPLDLTKEEMLDLIAFLKAL